MLDCDCDGVESCKLLWLGAAASAHAKVVKHQPMSQKVQLARALLAWAHTQTVQYPTGAAMGVPFRTSACICR